ncbi:DUF4087 domain-containing protein [Brucella pseudogrignonensis]
MILVDVSSHALAVTTSQRRCGWFQRSTPADVTLTDADGICQIGRQGGYQTRGDWPSRKRLWMRCRQCRSCNAPAG